MSKAELETRRAKAVAEIGRLEKDIADKKERQREEVETLRKLSFRLADIREKEVDLDLRLVGLGEDIVGIVKSFLPARAQ